MGPLTMIKNGLIAVCVFILAVFSALLFGKHKQKAADKAQAAKTATDELNAIKAKTYDVQSQVDKAPDNGPDSVSRQLRDDFTADN